MKVGLVKTAGEGFVTEDADCAEPVRREVLVDVRASGLCHTDLTWANYGMVYAPPFVLGHEISGVVSAVGPDVTEFSVGEHVVGCLLQYCGRCIRCLAGQVYQCLDPAATLRSAGEPPRLTLRGEPIVQGFGLGGFAERSLAHESQLVKVPDDLPFPQAALLGCAVVTGAGAVLNTADVQAGQAIVVIGVGGVGLNAVSAGVIAGATTIVAVDVAQDKLDKARTFGATHTVDSSAGDPVEAVRDITGGGANAVFDFVGVPAVSSQALEMVGVGGGLYLIGSIDPTAMVPVGNVALIAAQRRVQGVIMGSTVPKRDIPMYASLYAQGRLELDELISKEIALDQINEGYAALRDSAITRVVVTSF